MGQEIDTSRFTPREFSEFAARLAAETGTLHDWFEQARFSTRDRVGGFELEAWLVHRNGDPAPINEDYLDHLNDPLVVPELARFNVELNAPPQDLAGGALQHMYESLESTWWRCVHGARAFDAGLLMIGILPTLRESHLSADNMSDMRRYRALNEQVLAQRAGRPLQLDIHGREHLHTVHADVMLEAATTSFQIHLKVTLAQAARCFNAAQIVSAPVLAVAANSPYLFGRDLWAETRIPVFEQAVEVGGFDGAAHGPLRRVSFGNGYVRESLYELFAENLAHYPVLLPTLFDTHPETLPHLRLHNGTIWRWNRPLLGFDDDGTPHLRIEHRVAPGGPSAIDCIANAAFFFGLVQALGYHAQAPEEQLEFAAARDNFYAAARDGLEAQLLWLDGRRHGAGALIQQALLPLAREGLEQLALDRRDIEQFLGIIAARVHSGRNGAAWQREFVKRYGPDMGALTEAYRVRQDSGMPVHAWDL